MWNLDCFQRKYFIKYYYMYFKTLYCYSKASQKLRKALIIELILGFLLCIPTVRGVDWNDHSLAFSITTDSQSSNYFECYSRVSTDDAGMIFEISKVILFISHFINHFIFYKKPKEHYRSYIQESLLALFPSLLIGNPLFWQRLQGIWYVKLEWARYGAVDLDLKNKLFFYILFIKTYFSETNRFPCLLPLF